MSLLLSIVPMAIIGLLVVGGFMVYKHGFRIASYILFSAGLITLFIATALLPLLFPWMNEGLGIGWLILVTVGPLLLFFGFINLCILVYRFFTKTFDTSDKRLFKFTLIYLLLLVGSIVLSLISKFLLSR